MNKVNADTTCEKANCSMTVRVKAWTLHQYLVGLLACLSLSACVSLLEEQMPDSQKYVSKVTQRDLLLTLLTW